MFAQTTRSRSLLSLFALICGSLTLALALVGCGGTTTESTSSPTEATSAAADDNDPATDDAQDAQDSDSASPSASLADDYNQAGTLKSPIAGDYASGTHHATIEVADYGTIKVELNANVAPITVSNFAQLAEDGFYDGLTFHRIIDGFMIQGGDPNGDGTGGATRTIKGEFFANGITNTIQHKRGVISMARSSDYDSASSQFFIMHETTASLDEQYAAFGKVTEGMDVVDAIATTVPVEDSNGTVAPENQPVITSIRMDD